MDRFTVRRVAAATTLPGFLAGFLVGSLAIAGSAVAATNAEIPVTTSSQAARMDFIAGQAALDRGHASQANELFRAAVGADPDFTYGWYNLAVASFSTEEFSASLKKAAASAGKASAGERLLVEINQRFLDSNFESQLALANQLVQQYPKSARAWLTLAGVQAGLNKFAEQRQSIAKAIELDPALAVAPLAMGNSYLFNEPRDFAQSEKYFRQTIALQPGESTYWWSLGDVYRATNRLEEARDQYKRATLLDPSDGIAQLKLGHVDSFLGHYDEARADYDRGIATAEPVNKPFYENYKMFTWVHAGDASTAVRELEKLARDVDTMSLPDDQQTGAKVFALTNAVTVCLHTGMNDEAARVLDDLAAVLRANAKAVGTEEFSKIQESQIAYLQGQLAAHKGDYAQAQSLAKKYSELVAGQKNPRKMENYHDLLGLIAYLQKKYPQAVAEYRQADLTIIYNKYHLAMALEAAGQGAEARKLFKEVATWNFNTVGFALVRKDAIARAG
ncbi:MAG TPA: tetratricopeptide repeat protein [Steroidobacteraceae bacterium]|nr:tetratricopeptide repeat protein [Steroidobacteraceae bacterium]